jgi:hypothetical protein
MRVTNRWERKRGGSVAFLAAALGGAVLLAPARAAATSSFPSDIKSELNAPSVPSCALCHATAAGGGPVTQPFGQSMMARGLRGGNKSSLSTALQALEAEGTDSDGDGLGDVEELRMGLDPNFDGDAGSVPPQFGCGARVAPRAPNDWWSMVAGCLMAVALAMRRRRNGKVPGGDSDGRQGEVK